MTVLERIQTIKNELVDLIGDVEALSDDNDSNPEIFRYYSSLLIDLDHAKRALRSALYKERGGEHFDDIHAMIKEKSDDCFRTN